MLRHRAPGRHLAGSATAALAVLLLVTGCTAASQAVSSASPTPSPLGEGFLGGNPSPSPEATITPEAGSWAGVAVPRGYRVTLVAATADETAEQVVAATEEWAERDGVELDVVTAADGDEVESAIVDATTARVDLVLGAGAGIVDVFSLISAQHLDQRFLVVGAELPEPTENVTSVIWPGASFRGSGISGDDAVDPASYTPDRVAAGLSAGVAAVVHGITGIVIALP
ncbi:BMP family ABC transporter substrate-binding protein [Herbiconiux moechotypicola]|uniref:BMP family ABC transporter substrate-binding protein n=1 Tax=Herbiconiux moechotypicola TaxID=637393 RepID=A0ABN3E352_9MICO|nr:BMP family ABC transporter substrate-binding protein [Herbiconiux moechotypicola]MCS5731574.1 BMP family ABC transporter substrate-binding protein [Herbiconiux moechotypicola]